MPIFRYDKLVRDNIPAFHHESGHTVVGKQLKNDELISALIEKLHEETDEVSAALTLEQLQEELADVQQIINDICSLKNISQDSLAFAMHKKADRKGGFLKGAYIETVMMPDENDKWVAYCRRSPEKYPEISA